MNTDPKRSAQPCGCDPGADYYRTDCFIHDHQWKRANRVYDPPAQPKADFFMERPAGMDIFPDSADGRKEYPMFTGLLAYFPDALAEVAHVSFKGNKQHNPGEKLHWARGKSMDQTDTTVRHVMDHALVDPIDKDGAYHLAKAAWRILAELQLTIEKRKRNV